MMWWRVQLPLPLARPLRLLLMCLTVWLTARLMTTRMKALKAKTPDMNQHDVFHC